MSSKAHPPPVPPANRSPHVPQTPGKPSQAQGGQKPGENLLRAKDAQGENIAANTRNQGHQQDR